MKTCVWCKRNEQIDAYVGVCSLQCSRAYEAYERGKVDERVNALSGTDAYLKQAITEATNEAYQRGKADERAAVVAYIDKWGPWYPGMDEEGAAVTRALVYVSKSACELEQELIDAAVAWRQFKGNAEDGAYPWVRLLSAMEQAIDAVIADREATR